MSEKDVEAIIAKVDVMNEKIAVCMDMEELERLQKKRESYILKEFKKVRTSKKI